MMVGQGDLFDRVTLADGPNLCGLDQWPAFLLPGEEQALVARIDAEPLTPFRFGQWEGKRLTRSYGSSYDFTTGRMSAAPPIPDWLEPIRERAAGLACLAPHDLSQALLTRYDPGAGIGWHKDRPQYDKVVGVSLGAAATLRFRQRRSEGGFRRASVALEPADAYLLDGHVRHEWEHSIVPLGATRWSITFRSLSALGLRALG